MLRMGSKQVVSVLSRIGGLDNLANVHIPLPGSPRTLQTMLSKIGMSSLTDNLELVSFGGGVFKRVEMQVRPCRFPRRGIFPSPLKIYLTQEYFATSVGGRVGRGRRTIRDHYWQTAE